MAEKFHGNVRGEVRVNFLALFQSQKCAINNFGQTIGGAVWVSYVRIFPNI